MLYGNFKNCTYTQTTTNFNAGVGFFIALLITKYNPILITYEWYAFAIGLVLFMIPGLISTYVQLKAGVSLETIELNKRPFRTF
jgi:hypothetical protein|tara:strand:- start:475 stop:726 length:252 start_codon:yes stop_codon:yes gene_type:complete